MTDRIAPDRSAFSARVNSLETRNHPPLYSQECIKSLTCQFVVDQEIEYANDSGDLTGNIDAVGASGSVQVVLDRRTPTLDHVVEKSTVLWRLSWVAPRIYLLSTEWQNVRQNGKYCGLIPIVEGKTMSGPSSRAPAYPESRARTGQMKVSNSRF